MCRKDSDSAILIFPLDLLEIKKNPKTFIKLLLPMNDESFCFSIEHQVAMGPSSRLWVSEKIHIFKGFLLLRKEVRKEMKTDKWKLDLADWKTVSPREMWSKLYSATWLIRSWFKSIFFNNFPLQTCLVQNPTFGSVLNLTSVCTPYARFYTQEFEKQQEAPQQRGPHLQHILINITVNNSSHFLCSH